MRLFIAIPMNAKVKESLLTTQEAFRHEGIQGNYTPQENFHLTLAFIGEYGDPDKVMEALEGIRFVPFTIRLDQVGCFDDLWWAGIAESDALKNLASRVRRALAEADIPYDKKRFKPHITLLRRAVIPRRSRQESLPQTDISMKVNHFSLMQSTRGKHGMIYTEIGQVTCTDGKQEQDL